MTKMIKYIVAVLALSVGLSTTSVAGEKVVPQVVPTPVETIDALNAKAFGACVIKDSDTYEFGGGLSLEARLIGGLYGEVVGTVFEDEVYSAGANLLYYVPITDSVSTYLLAGGAYDFETDQWVVGAGAGLSFKVADSVSLFTDGTYNFTVENDDSDGVVTIRAGIRLGF